MFAKVLWKACFGSQRLRANRGLASVERATLVYIISVQIQYNKRNRNGGRDDFLLKCNIGQ